MAKIWNDWWDTCLAGAITAVITAVVLVGCVRRQPPEPPPPVHVPSAAEVGEGLGRRTGDFGRGFVKGWRSATTDRDHGHPDK